MGARGPGKTPSNIKQFRGTARADRMVNEAKPSEACTDPPKWLRGRDERAIYKRLAEVLAPAGLLTEADTEALGTLCKLQALQNRYLEEKPEATVVGTRGQPIANPTVKLIIDLQDKIEKLYKHFGLTPSARADIDLPPRKKSGDPMEDLLQGEG